MATTQSRKREKYYIEVSAGNYIELSLQTSSYSSGLLGALGIQKAKPAENSIVGYGKEAAYLKGCVPVRLVYQRTASKTQTAHVLCSPRTADNIYAAGASHTYNGKDITQVRFPRRRTYVY